MSHERTKRLCELIQAVAQTCCGKARKVYVGVAWGQPNMLVIQVMSLDGKIGGQCGVDRRELVMNKGMARRELIRLRTSYALDEMEPIGEPHIVRIA